MTLVEDYIKSNERLSIRRFAKVHTSAFVTQSSSQASGTAPDFLIAQDHREGRGDRKMLEWIEFSMYTSNMYTFRSSAEVNEKDLDEVWRILWEYNLK